MGKVSNQKAFVSKTPYKGYRLPGTMEEEENRLAEAVDPDLKPEDHGMVLRYLHYADTLLNSPEEDRPAPFLFRPGRQEDPQFQKEQEQKEDTSELQDRKVGRVA